MGRAAPAPAGAMDCDAEPTRSCPTRRRAIMTRMPAWALTARAASSPCRSIRSRRSGAISAISRRAFPAIPIRRRITGLYRTPHLHLRVRGVYTNTVPVDAYRGSGRPEATWINERLIERGAHELGIDVVEMRRRNLIGREDFPYPAPGGRVYDSGDPPALLDKLLSLANYPALRREQAELRRQGHPHGHRACLLHRQGRHRAERQPRQARRPAWRLGKRRSCACIAMAR